MNYHQKPVAIQAVEVSAVLRGSATVPLWAHDASQRGGLFNGTRNSPTLHVGKDAVTVVTPLGGMRAERGDFIIRAATGELSAVKPDVFAATYQEVGA